MADTLFFVYPDAAQCDGVAADFRSRGWATEVASPSDADALDRMDATQPVAAVFCMDGDESGQTLALAEAVLADERLQRPLIVFVGGSPDDVGRARESMPYAVFVKPDELAWVLKRLAVKS